MNAAAMRELRQRTGAGMMDCSKALRDAEGDVDRAVALLRERGIVRAAALAKNETSQGVIEAYLHRTGDFPPQVGVLIELRCETDFVAKEPGFRELAREIAMHIAAMAPQWIDRDQIDSGVLLGEQMLQDAWADEQGMPEGERRERAISGRMEAYFAETCLCDQPYVRDPSRKIGELLAEYSAKVRENVRVASFTRYSLK